MNDGTQAQHLPQQAAPTAITDILTTKSNPNRQVGEMEVDYLVNCALRVIESGVSTTLASGEKVQATPEYVERSGDDGKPVYLRLVQLKDKKYGDDVYLVADDTEDPNLIVTKAIGTLKIEIGSKGKTKAVVVRHDDVEIINPLTQIGDIRINAAQDVDDLQSILNELVVKSYAREINETRHRQNERLTKQSRVQSKLRKVGATLTLGAILSGAGIGIKEVLPKIEVLRQNLDRQDKIKKLQAELDQARQYTVQLEQQIQETQDQEHAEKLDTQNVVESYKQTYKDMSEDDRKKLIEFDSTYGAFRPAKNPIKIGNTGAAEYTIELAQNPDFAHKRAPEILDIMDDNSESTVDLNGSIGEDADHMADISKPRQVVLYIKDDGTDIDAQGQTTTKNKDGSKIYTKRVYVQLNGANDGVYVGTGYEHSERVKVKVGPNYIDISYTLQKGEKVPEGEFGIPLIIKSSSTQDTTSQK